MRKNSNGSQQLSKPAKKPTLEKNRTLSLEVEVSWRLLETLGEKFHFRYFVFNLEFCLDIFKALL